MKQRVMVLAALMLLSCPIFASEISDLTVIEKELFGIEYKDENVTKRLNRVEKYLFGEVKTGTNAQRIKNIADSSGISFMPKQTAEQKRIASADYMPEDNSVTYPIIDMMEQETFKKSYHGENVYKRVARLEQKAFGKSFEGDLSERTDKLKAALLAQKPEIITYDEDYQPSNYNSYSTNQSLAKNDDDMMFSFSKPPFSTSYPTGGAASAVQGYDSNDFEYVLSAAEKMIFGKSNKNIPNSDRLDKLEKKVFKKTFSGDKVSRLERVVSAANAQRTGNVYRENKWDKYISTGIQVGSILLMILAMIL